MIKYFLKFTMGRAIPFFEKYINSEHSYHKIHFIHYRRASIQYEKFLTLDFAIGTILLKYMVYIKGKNICNRKRNRCL